jgi:hypothetical protein
LKEVIMAAHGHTATLGTHIETRQATQGWYAQVKAWLGTHHAAKRSALSTYWDARREAVRPFRADAAIDMVPQAHLDTTARAMCELAL